MLPTIEDDDVPPDVRPREDEDTRFVFALVVVVVRRPVDVDVDDDDDELSYCTVVSSVNANAPIPPLLLPPRNERRG